MIGSERTRAGGGPACVLLGLMTLAAVAVGCSSGPESTAATSDTAAQRSEPVVSIEEAAAAAKPSPANGLKFLAHRGVHQTFDPTGVDDQTCTAERIDVPSHGYLENTIASMEAAFAAGASVVEIDIAPTVDGVLAVFHDWDVGCRTDRRGEIRTLTWDELSLLDVGYGYTADGETYPLRGTGVGAMPRLEEVFASFPDGRFLINFKSDDPGEAALLNAVVEAQDAAHQVWAVYGGGGAVDAYVALTGTRGFSEASVTTCLGDYLAAQDQSETITTCDNTVVAVPSDIGPVLPGWPHTFVERMKRHGTDVIIFGPGQTGIDTSSDLAALPHDLDAYVWTDRVEALTAG